MSGKWTVVVFLLMVNNVISQKSPNGEYISQQFPNIHDDIAEDARLDVIGLLTKYGYPSESHEVQTEDGYLLTVHRITGTKNEVVTAESLSQKPAVFLMHGLLSSSADWINAGVDVGFGYLLANEGYDVWMGNARGNFYSRKHVSLDPKKSAFWRFSWDEIGYYDLPAMIDAVLLRSGKSQLHYAGHSQGTTAFFVMGSRRPEYNDKIISMQALGPAAYMSNLVSPLVRFLAYAEKVGLEYLFTLLGANEVLPNSELMTIAGDMLCKDDAIFQPVCSNILFLLCGFNPDLHNATMLPVILGHTPAGAASRQIVHYTQGINSALFRRYDHGALNLLVYGTLRPPQYDLGKVTAPVFLHYSDNDWMVAAEDVRQLNRELGNSYGMFRVPHDKFNHLDYLWAIDIRSLLYNRVLTFMAKFN